MSFRPAMSRATDVAQTCVKSTHISSSPTDSGKLDAVGHVADICLALDVEPHPVGDITLPHASPENRHWR